jgi:hypothetical protein
MVKITGYDRGLVFFECDQCDNVGVEDISDRITDDCVFIVEPLCTLCGDTGLLSFLHCSTEYKAKELLAELESLKSRRRY